MITWIAIFPILVALFTILQLVYIVVSHNASENHSYVIEDTNYSPRKKLVCSGIFTVAGIATHPYYQTIKMQDPDVTFTNIASFIHLIVASTLMAVHAHLCVGVDDFATSTYCIAVRGVGGGFLLIISIVDGYLAFKRKSAIWNYFFKRNQIAISYCGYGFMNLIPSFICGIKGAENGFNLFLVFFNLFFSISIISDTLLFRYEMRRDKEPISVGRGSTIVVHFDDGTEFSLYVMAVIEIIGRKQMVSQSKKKIYVFGDPGLGVGDNVLWIDVE